MAMEVGAVQIRVRPQLKGFREQVERELKGMPDQMVGVGADTDQMEKDIDQGVERAGKRSRVAPRVDSKDFQARYKKLAKDMQASFNKKITLDVDLKGDALKARVFELEKQYDSLLGDRLRKQAKYLNSQLGGVDAPKLKVDVSPEVSVRDLQDGLDKVQSELRERNLEITTKFKTEYGDTDFTKNPHTEEWARVMRKMDDRPIINRVKNIRQVYTALYKDVDKSSARLGEAFDVDFDVDGLDLSLGKAAKGFDGLGKSAQRSGGKVKHTGKTFLGLTRTGWIVAGISAVAAPAIEAVSGLSAALPALGSAAAVGIGAIALGFDGIKSAASAAAPALNQVKQDVSGVFESRLTSQFAALGDALVSWSPGLQSVAHGLSDMSQGFVAAVTSVKGMASAQEVLRNTSELFSGLKPATSAFTEGMLEMAAVGSRTFPKLSEMMTSGMNDFKKSVSEMADSGALQSAIESTYTVAGSMFSNLGRIVRAGIESFTPEVAAAYDGLFDGFADGITGLLPVFSEASAGLASGLGEVFADIGSLGSSIGPGLADAVTGIADGFTAISAAGAGIGEVLAPLTTLAGLGLEGLGSGLKSFADGLSEVGNNASSMDQLVDSMLAADQAASQASDSGKSMADTWDWMLRNIKDNGRIAGENFKVMFDPENLGLAKMTQAMSDANVALSDYMSGFQRFNEFGMAMNNPELVIEVGIRKLDGGDLQAQIQNLVQDLENTEKVLKIDLDAQIELAKGAKSTAELQQLADQVADAFRAGTLGKPAEVKVPVEPKAEVAPGAAADTTAAQPIVDKVKQDMEASLSSLSPELQESISSKVSESLSTLELNMDNAATSMSTNLGAKIAEQFALVDIPMEGFKLNIGQKIQESFALGSFDFAPALTNFTAGLSTAFATIDIPMAGLTTNIQTKLSEAFTGLMGQGPGLPLEGLVNGIKTGIESGLNNMQLNVNIAGALRSSLVSGIAEAAGTVQAAMGMLRAAIESGIGTVNLAPQGLQAGMSFTMGLRSGMASALGVAASMAASVQGACHINLFGSGAAAGASFAAGLRSQVGAVASAAAALAAAASAYMPHSPAEKGPLSGRGYTTHSGKALALDFAASMRAHQGDVGAAAASLTGAVAAEFEGLNRQKIDDETREANAKKLLRSIEQHDKAIEKAKERHAESMAKWEKEGRKGKAPEYKDPEYTLPELDKPDYNKIDRSIKGFYTDTLTWAFEKELDAWTSNEMPSLVKQVDKELTAAFGDYPFSAEVRNMMNDPRLPKRLQKIMKQAKVAQLPVEIVVQNLDQLKSDLGMSDGAIPRALKVLYEYNPANSDDYQESKEEKAPEYHFHVLTVEEALRIKEIEDKKRFMKEKV